jgi:peptidoglycan/xylan/chitin deacetylase (PgdA/CDA1 family)
VVPGRQQDILSRVSRRLAEFDRAKSFMMRNRRPIVSFTFDDIPDSALANGARLLSRHGVHGTFYVAGGICGTEAFGWRFADARSLRRLLDDGHEIGCHTFSHPDVQALDRAALDREFELNRAFFAKLDARVRLDNFAYPYGSVGLRQKRAVQGRFLSCRSVREGINAGRIDLGFLKAVRLYDCEITPRGVDAIIAETVRLNGWLLFYTHDVADPPSRQGSSPWLLDHAVRSAQAAGCVCLGVREALTEIGTAPAPKPVTTAQAA